MTARRSYWERRLTRQAGLALASVCIGALAWPLAPHRTVSGELSFATAYAGLVLLAAALVIGPLNVLRRRPNPVSTDLRRDAGIWAALCGIAHTIAGLQVHMHGQFARYFLPAPGTHADRGATVFFTANYLGMAATILLLLLMSLSNDFALRKLGVPLWKLLQRSSYILVAAVVVHGALYQMIEKRAGLLVVVFGATALVVLVLQLGGMRKKLTRRAVRAETPDEPAEEHRPVGL